MNCKFITDNIDALVAHDLDAYTFKAAQNHIKHCADCRQAITEHEAYLNDIKQFSTPSLSAKKKKDLFNNAYAAHTANSKGSGHFIKGFMAASILFVCVVLGLFTMHNPTPNVAENDFLTTQVMLVIYVPDDMQNADLAINLPENVELIGYEGISVLDWQVDLKQGANTLALPVKLHKDTDLATPLSFVATITFNDQSKEYALNVNVSPEQLKI